MPENRLRLHLPGPQQLPVAEEAHKGSHVQSLDYTHRTNTASTEHDTVRSKNASSSKSASPRMLPSSFDSVRIDADVAPTKSSDRAEIEQKISYVDIFRYATKYELFLNIFGICMAVAAGAAQPMMNIFIGKISTVFLAYTSAIQSGDEIALRRARDAVYHTINSDALILLYLGIGIFFTSMIYMAAFSYTSERTTSSIKYAYLSALMAKPIDFFEAYGQGTVAAKIGSDVHLIQVGIGEKLPMAIMYFATFLSAAAVGFSFSWRLSLVLLPIAPLILFSGGAMSVLTKKNKQIELGCIAKAASRSEEAFNAIKVLKAFSKEHALVDAYGNLTAEVLTAGANTGRVQGLGVGALLFVIYAGYALAFFYGAQLIARGELEPGRIVSVVFANFAGAFAIANLFGMIEHFTMATAAATSIIATIRQDAKHPTTPEPQLVEANALSEARLDPAYNAEVTFDSVDFAYPAKPERLILHGLALRFQSGVTTAIVGSSGCGKSTIISMLQRFYQPTRGAIHLDGVDIRNLNVDWLRSQIGVVEQQPTLFAMSIADNIRLGLSDCENRSEDELNELVIQAAKKANAHDFISALAHGYATQVGSQGFLLSGGQRQRIAIARALIRDPKILLLDEATSALDSSSEAVVQAALDEAAKDRTTIIVSHRLSTVRNASHVIVLGPEGVLEQGSYQELKHKPGGVFSSMLPKDDNQHDMAELKEASPVEGRLPLSPAAGGEESSLNLSRFLPSEADHPSPMHSTVHQPDTGRLGEVGVSFRTSTSEQDEKHLKSFNWRSTEKKAGGLRSLLFLLLKDSQTGKLGGLYVLGLLCAAMIGAVYPIYAILFGTAMEDYAPCNNSGRSCPEPERGVMLRNNRISSGSFFVVAVGCAIISFFHVRSLHVAGSRVTHRLRVLLFESLLWFDASFFDDPSNTSSDLASSLSKLSQDVNGGVGPTLGLIVQSLATVVVGYSVALGYGWRLALVVIASTPLTITAGLLRLRVLAHKESETKEAHHHTTQQACESIGAIRTISAFNLQPRTLKLYQKHLEKASRSLIPTMCFSSLLFAMSQCVQLLVTALAFWYGGRELAAGRTTSKGFFTILIAVCYGSIQAGNVFNYSADFSGARSAACKSLSIIRQAQQVIQARENERGAFQKLESPTPSGQITFENVTFRYPQRPTSKVLNNLSLNIESGTFCAIVGGSGGGKSTMIQLIERFYTPEKGRVLLDGHSIREGDPANFRKYLSYVPQEPTLFEGTIGWNIALGVAGVNPEEVPLDKIRGAAKLAQLDDLLASLPDGLDTQLSARGVQMSGGQKQKIAIARAMIRDPRVLLLDEATSALDPASEKAVQSALDSVSQGRTTIAVAHRLSTIAKADKVFVMRAGEVVEEGSPRELFQQDGVFAHMARLQGLSF